MAKVLAVALDKDFQRDAVRLACVFAAYSVLGVVAINLGRAFLILAYGIDF